MCLCVCDCVYACVHVCMFCMCVHVCLCTHVCGGGAGGSYAHLHPWASVIPSPYGGKCRWCVCVC